MERKPPEHTLEFLLAFNGRVHWLEEGYRIEFRIRRTPSSRERPHGLQYSFTLHDPDGKRLVRFDNAHAVKPRGSPFKKRPMATDHWHRTESDAGRPYEFKGADTLLRDFFREVARVLGERGIPDTVVKVEEERK